MSVAADIQQAITIDEEEIENVNTFTYIGSGIDSEESSTADINCRTGKARSVLVGMRKVWASNQYTRCTKLKLYKSNVLSVFMYRAQCRSLSKRDGDRTNACHNIYLRWIFKIFWSKIKSNAELYRKVEMASATSVIRARDGNG